MKVLVFSDSHGHTKNMIKVLKKHPEIQIILHLGDYASDTAALLEGSPTLMVEAVLGNNDKIKTYPDEKIVTLAGKRILLTHGYCYNVGHGLLNIHYKAMEQQCEAVLFGHTHIPLVESAKGILYVNPGSIFRQRVLLGPTYALMEISEQGIKAEIKHLRDLNEDM